MPGTLLPSGRRPYLAGGVAYSGATRDIVVDQYGQIESVHWLDEGMGIAMTVDRGSGGVKSAPTTGNTLRQIQYLGGADLGDRIKAAVMSAQPLKRYVDAGQAKITSITWNVGPNRLEVFVHYVNLLTETSRDTVSHGKRLEWYSDG